MPKQKIVLLSHRSSHHASRSGYTHLGDTLGGKSISGAETNISYRLSKLVSSKIQKTVPQYDSSSFAKEIALLRETLTSKNGVGHFLNGERDIRFSPGIVSLTNWKLSASFHYPPSRLKEVLPNTKYVSKLDGMVAVGVSQLDMLHSWSRSAKIKYIPHGVDTNYFSPKEVDVNMHSAIFVGVHLRDIELLKKIVEVLAKEQPLLKLHVVVPHSFKDTIPVHPAIIVHAGINDERLLELYRSSSFLLLPLKDVTACNAILEAMACGLPIITNNHESNRAYVSSASGFLIEGQKIEDWVKAAISLMTDKALNLQMRVAARENSLQFSWQEIDKQLNSFFTEL